jgi:hypothetical protein
MRSVIGLLAIRNPQSAIRNPQSAILYRFFVRDDCDLPLFLLVLRELLLAELIRGPEVLLALPRELLALLRAVFVAALTLRLRESELLLRELADLFLARLDRVLLDAALLPPAVDLMLADLAPLDTLAALPSLLPRPLLVFLAASSLPNSLAT